MLTGRVLNTRPELYEDLADTYVAFYTLGAGRQFNEVGPQPIPLTDIVAYLNDRNVEDSEERREFHHLVRVMDSRFLNLAHDKLARERERLMKQSNTSRR